MLKKLLSFFLFSLSLAAPASAQDDMDFDDHLMLVQIVAQANHGDIRMYTPPISKEGIDDAECLAVAIYHESRGEPLPGQLAVASVIQQRVLVKGRWGENICDVVVPVQFSFMIDDVNFPPINDFDAWNQSIAIADHMMTTGPLPEFGDADHYHATSVAPDWAPKLNMVEQIGDHIFYQDPQSKT